MKVSELQKLLADIDPNTEIILSRDSEGNGYHKLSGIDHGTIPPTELKEYHIDAYYSDSHTDDQCCLDAGERQNFAKVICLWP